MEIHLRKYRTNTKQWQCYEIVPNDAHIKGTIFFPLETTLPDLFPVQLPDMSILADLANGKI